MDRLFWGPHWVKPTDDQFFEKLNAALNTPNWILDENYDRSVLIKWKNVTSVIWVDYSLPRTLLQAMRRVFTNWWFKKGLGFDGENRESLRKSFFSHDSILLWTIKTFKSNRRRYEARMQDPEYRHISFFRLRSPTDVDRFLESLTSLDKFSVKAF